MNIGRRIRTLRTDASLSQEAVAQRAGIPLNRISRIERGEVTDPHYSTLAKIAYGLRISLIELLSEEEPFGSEPGQSRDRDHDQGPEKEADRELLEAGASSTASSRPSVEITGAEAIPTAEAFGVPDIAVYAKMLDLVDRLERRKISFDQARQEIQDEIERSA